MVSAEWERDNICGQKTPKTCRTASAQSWAVGRGGGVPGKLPLLQPGGNPAEAAPGTPGGRSQSASSWGRPGRRQTARSGRAPSAASPPPPSPAPVNTFAMSAEQAVDDLQFFFEAFRSSPPPPLLF